MSTKAPGQTSLSTLLSTLTLTLHPETYIFLSLTTSQFVAPFPIPLADIALFFRESEGVTLVVPLPIAQKYGFDSDSDSDRVAYPCRMVTCNVQSSLEAVGFMAVLATRLAAKGISVNPVSGYYHDHLFVPLDRAEDSVLVLEEVAESARREMEQGES